ncbi:uracil-DNA glycosylase [Gracilibacillus halophilus YIM-C55.5]|uniref:Uracil-DNA glycosylase n=1 Tax=Gracilibacillus halophilus YIM-C55.5 TaxID=1308866 RepID=N4WMR4_9BACI|nr:uracil-DNA glycosylase [Gracilibacillus halophilus]ENH95810.1 uracil-DNA glycosylase [Gracilibacillus halophilus YIM-C55.5]
MPNGIFTNDWGEILQDELQKDYYQNLREFLKREYQQYTVHPDMYDIFNALHYTSFANVKVVILGQDPYHGPNQAHGLSFSVNPDVAIPPSLKNIFKELHEDIGCSIPNHGHLVKWAEQGVLLLNNVLTVREGQAHSHRGKGWETFTDHIIKTLNDKETPVVYVLWGAAARKKQALIDTNKHYVITSPHPSPLSAHRGFFGSRPFSKSNAILQNIGQEPIDWEVPPLG